MKLLMRVKKKSRWRRNCHLEYDKMWIRVIAKRKLNEILEELQQNEYDHVNNPDFDLELFQEPLWNKYHLIQNELLSYNLSDIPFGAWSGVELSKDENGSIDLSKTKANIDFKIIDYWGPGNFNGCNIRNI